MGGLALLTSFQYWKRRVLASSAWDVDGVEVPRKEGDYVDDDDFGGVVACADDADGGVVDGDRGDGDDGFDRVKFGDDGDDLGDDGDGGDGGNNGGWK